MDLIKSCVPESLFWVAVVMPSFKYVTTVEGTTGTSTLKISPVNPSIEIGSPSLILISPICAKPSDSFTSSSSAPQTAVLPTPRATTAA